MYVTLPYVKRDFDEKTEKITEKKGELRVEIDTSYQAHLKWEEQFQTVLKCDLNTYIERAKKWIKNESTAKANFLGLMKILYCCINSKELPTFSDFLKLFDVTTVKPIMEKIDKVFEELGKTASKN